MCIEAGIKTIEHGPFLSEKTLKLMAKEDVWLSPQAYLFQMTPESLQIVGTPAEPKMRKVNDEADQVLKTAQRLGVKIAWGTDLFGPLPKQALQPLEFTARQKYFSNLEILKQATSGNAEMFKLSGKRHPYQEGELGLIQAGAYADLLLTDGNPLENLGGLDVLVPKEVTRATDIFVVRARNLIMLMTEVGTFDPKLRLTSGFFNVRFQEIISNSILY